jgi:phosphoglycerol transferase
MLILLGSLWSQLSWFQVATPFHYQSFLSDQIFFAQIEEHDPRAVYQLPYKAFPETPEIHLLSDYDLLKGYLHIDQPVAWSYASMKGRAGSSWLEGLSQFPIETQLLIIGEQGFEGLYLDRFGWADNGQEIEASISAILNSTPLVSNDGRLVYYQLKE